MKKRGFVLALGLTGLLALGALAEGTIEDALAQQSPPPAGGPQHGPGGPGHEMHRDWSPGKHIEGRIAYMRAELKITPAQAPLFDAVANYMRADAKKMDDKMAKMRAEHEKGAGAPHEHEHKSAIEAIQGHITMEQEHIQHANEFLAVLKPLYATFTEEQKKAADEMLARYHGHQGRM
jgi:hypothetical protein